MFRRLDEVAGTIRFAFDGRDISARPGDTIAAALLAAGERSIGANPVTAAERAPFCMMGVCFECLVEVDGVGNRQACLTTVQDGMRVRRLQGPRGVL